jgi:hypothetical protein
MKLINQKIVVEKVSSSMAIKGGLVGPNREVNFLKHLRVTEKGNQANIPEPGDVIVVSATLKL